MRRRPQTSHVPSTTQVQPGAPVHIVLKEDQPTGRTVQGLVRDVLTRGNHPRGIKVRLTDGRVGRVQRMGDAAVAARVAAQQSTSVEMGAGLMWDLEEPAHPGGSGSQGHRDARWRAAPGPVNGEGETRPAEQLGLDAYIKPAKQRRKGKNGKDGSGSVAEAGDDFAGGPGLTTTTSPTEVLLDCPVCGDFKGDEAAVAHHVGTHFD